MQARGVPSRKSRTERSRASQDLQHSVEWRMSKVTWNTVNVFLQQTVAEDVLIHFTAQGKAHEQNDKCRAAESNLPLVGVQKGSLRQLAGGLVFWITAPRVYLREISSRVRSRFVIVDQGSLFHCIICKPVATLNGLERKLVRHELGQEDSWWAVREGRISQPPQLSPLEITFLGVPLCASDRVDPRLHGGHEAFPFPICVCGEHSEKVTKMPVVDELVRSHSVMMRVLRDVFRRESRPQSWCDLREHAGGTSGCCDVKRQR